MKLEADREEELVDVFHEFDVDGDNKISDEDIVKKF